MRRNPTREVCVRAQLKSQVLSATTVVSPQSNTAGTIQVHLGYLGRKTTWLSRVCEQSPRLHWLPDHREPPEGSGVRGGGGGEKILDSAEETRCSSGEEEGGGRGVGRGRGLCTEDGRTAWCATDPRRHDHHVHDDTQKKPPIMNQRSCP